MNRLAILAIMIMAAAGAAASPIGPYQSPNGMSVYFDLEGEVDCVAVADWEPGPEAGFSIMAYLLLTYPNTEFPFVKAWEAHVEFESNSYLPPFQGMALTPGAIDIDPDPVDYVVGCGGPAAILITGDFTLLASVELNWLGYEGTADCTVRVDGVEGSVSFPNGAGYAPEPGFPIPGRPYYCWGCECARVTAECEDIGYEELTWGAVKSLY